MSPRSILTDIDGVDSVIIDGLCDEEFAYSVRVLRKHRQYWQEVAVAETALSNVSWLDFICFKIQILPWKILTDSVKKSSTLRHTNRFHWMTLSSTSSSSQLLISEWALAGKFSSTKRTSFFLQRSYSSSNSPGEWFKDTFGGGLFEKTKEELFAELS